MFSVLILYFTVKHYPITVHYLVVHFDLQQYSSSAIADEVLLLH